MSCILYLRVSTKYQNESNGSSLLVQEQLCKKYTVNNNLIITEIIKEVGSAYTKYKKLKIQSIIDSINTNNFSIVFNDVSRFSRNLLHGLELASNAVAKNIKLIFVKENIIIQNINNLNLIVQHLTESQSESKNISIRIATSKKYAKDNNKYSGGRIPFGYEVETKTKEILPVAKELDVIEFIKKCRTIGVTEDELNTQMKKILGPDISSYAEIILNSNVETGTSEILEKLTFKNIAEILNDYSVFKRGLKWNVFGVRRAYDNGIKNKPIAKISDCKIINKRKFLVVNNSVPTIQTGYFPQASRLIQSSIGSISSSSVGSSSSSRVESSSSSRVESSLERIEESSLIEEFNEFKLFKLFKSMKNHN
jgi:DNA invertase Pin-like site-specific DNA recombinase